ncbi:MAG: hypothetical protein NC924_05395 [Candidatus Omnitrophica bacterium]|nr:hypothetical protein [Candidatus Omnitrophota bacterium]
MILRSMRIVIASELMIFLATGAAYALFSDQTDPKQVLSRRRMVQEADTVKTRDVAAPNQAPQAAAAQSAAAPASVNTLELFSPHKTPPGSTPAAAVPAVGGTASGFKRLKPDEAPAVQRAKQPPPAGAVDKPGKKGSAVPLVVGAVILALGWLRLRGEK